MLHYIKGTLAMKTESGIVVEAGGLGYELTVPANSGVYLAKEGDEITVFTAMIVREDDISLFGFGEKAALDTFRKLITVSGVGAKAAIAILSAMPLSEVHQAIILEDAKSLTRANGIGKKTAERIVLELKDKFGTLEEAALPESSGSGAAAAGVPGDSRTEAIDALIALGYTRGEAANALATVKEKDLTVEEYIKQALKRLF
ncbi:Holliday junction branch migration protein RuvA [Anaerovorax odorimutans]|uniref:Holliday junction branch migration complex subunit RuvA n=1 Tax=Anaerovorax odorimutans TaxID=109327 RepID=A0ABT1RQA3_9FIRM|nr:Holliday junction branch migration protein RuvA [Anaerovorax odorimutans]MCQ4637362.1 Holliday junction branch migration protein RuvA [Anaerovorax odorimutans]